MTTSPTIGFVGAGQMARALAGGFVRGGLIRGEQILSCDPVPAAVEQLRKEVPGAVAAKSNRDLAEKSDVIFLAVKPQAMNDVYAELAGTIKSSTVVVSIAAGIPLEKLCGGLKTQRVIRVMPNTPCLVECGASAYSLAAAATKEDDELVGKLLSAVGFAKRVDEKLLDAVTGLSGSGPAYVFLMIEALADGGVRMGIPRDLALALAAHTVRGAAQMVITEREHPAVLKDAVTSPGGTTIAGLQALEDRGVRGALIAAVEAATKRSKELGA